MVCSDPIHRVNRNRMNAVTTNHDCYPSGFPVEHSHYFATCARGLENVLAEELRQLGAAEVTPGRGGAHFAGDLVLFYQANLWLRTAVRVLRPVLEAPVTSPEELY